ncbi:hypothetical protein [Schinkia azotoformans]|uniref:hypothetical protein n=1 Tax=Schinkia azotoformans TaxID=1454 RepID=UPI002DBD1A4F|nr:hypothetical protein [Schinkia azotoformans]MEC1780083.1 hypothetical protein [Schinkia azotoformans]MED4330838.1 hypothetical protein [Schinkia azotoformans]
MKKKLIIGISAIGLFMAGSFANASTSWVQTVITDANKKIGAAGYNKKEELLSNLDSKIQEKMAQNMDGKIEAKEAEVEQALEDYFNQKVASLDNGEEAAQIEQQLDVITENVIGRYREEIDQKFGTVY